MRGHALIIMLVLPLLAMQETRAQSGRYVGLYWDGSTEYLVAVNPFNSTKTNLAAIPGVRIISAGSYAADTDSNRYLFVGGASASSRNYYLMDAENGAVISTSPVVENIANIAYNPNDKTYYGLWWDAATSREYFVTLDPRTSEMNVLDTIHGVATIVSGNRTIDTDSNRYIFVGRESSGPSRYYVIDVVTGGLISSTPAPETTAPGQLSYSPADRAFYGIWWDAVAGKEYFVTVNPYTGVKDNVDLLEHVNLVSAMNHAFDPDSNRYVFIGGPASNSMAYTVVDASSGEVISSSMQTDRINGLAWFRLAPPPPPEPSALRFPHAAGAWSLRRAPDGVTTVLFGNPSGIAHTLSLHDISGKAVMSLSGIRADKVRFETSRMKAGVYLFSLRSANGVAAAGKLIVE